MEKETKRNFKGVWIPKQIWLDKNLGWSEKLLLVEIESLDNEEGCYASNAHFADFFGLSKDRISRMISILKKKGYLDYKVYYKEGTKQIEKRVIKIDKLKFHGIGENTDTPRTKRREGIGENTKDNNTVNNTININNNTSSPKATKKDKYTSDSPYYQMAQYLYDWIKKNNPIAKEPNWQQWADDFRKIVEIDKRETKGIKKVIDFSQTDDFWHTNILSPSKLRKQYEQLYGKSIKTKKQVSNQIYKPWEEEQNGQTTNTAVVFDNSSQLSIGTYED